MRRLRHLVRHRSSRWEEGVCVIEGPDLVEAALESAVPFEGLFVEASALARNDVSAIVARAQAVGVRVFALDARALDKVADTQTPQPLLAAVHFATTALTEVAPTGLVLVLDNLRDPGNMGTIIRSAEAAGASALVLSGDCVDPFNPKALRASAGAIFHLPVALAPLDAATSQFRRSGRRSFAAVLEGGTPYRDCDLSGHVAVVIGNEAAGLNEADIGRCDETMTIPMAGRSQSLNAAVAAALIAFEALAQRRGASAG